MAPRAGILIFLAAAFQSGAAAAETFAYWVQPCKGSEVRCQDGDEQLAFWALSAWEKASAGVAEAYTCDDGITGKNSGLLGFRTRGVVWRDPRHCPRHCAWC